MSAESFDLRLVAPFVAITGSVTYAAAAARLGMTPSTLAGRVGRLERQLGARLFDRDGRRVALTPAGERFLVEARTILDRAGQVAAALRVEAGAVRVHLVGASVSHELGAAIERFGAEHPDVQLVITEGTSAQASAALRRGDADVAFDYPNGTPPGASYAAWDRRPFMFVCGPGHRLAEREEAAWSELEGEAVLVAPAGIADAYNVSLRAALARSVVRVREVMGPGVTKARYVVPMVARGDAALVLPAWSCEVLPGLACVALTPAQDVEFGVSWYPSATGPAVQSFVALLRSLAPVHTVPAGALAPAGLGP